MKKWLFILCLFSLHFLRGQNADIDILKKLNQHNLPVWDRGMKDLSLSVYPISMAAPLGILAQGYFKKDKTMVRNGYKSVVTIVLAMALSTGMKYFVQRERPYVRYPLYIIARDKSGTYSFPSGHTTAAFATATSLSLTYKKWYIVLPAYTYAGFVGYARMRLGMHYPSDVLGGIVTGIGSGFLTWKLEKLLFKK